MSLASRAFVACFLLMAAATALAGSTAASAAPAALTNSALSLAGLLQVLVGLFFVLAAVAGAAWLLRRMAPGQTTAGGVMKVVGAMAVGPKERVVLVEVGDTWLVLGVAPGQVNALHALPKQVVPGGAVPGMSPLFSDWLKRAMDKQFNRKGATHAPD